MKIPFFKKSKQRADYVIIIVTIILVGYGLLMLSSASLHIGEERFEDPYFYVKSQIIYGLTAGLLGFFIALNTKYRVYEKFAIIFIIISLGLPILLLTPLGLELKGATRQIELGIISFQPGEIIKLTFILYIAAWLAGGSERQKSFSNGFIPFLILTGTLAALLLYLRSTSTAVITMGAAFIMYWVSGAKLRFIGLMALIGTIAFVGVVMISPYRLARVKNLFNPDANLETTGFHRNQSLIAIGSGGLWGVGYGQSTTKISYLPEVIGDSIFAVIAEEFGFIGVGILLLLFFVLIMKMLLVANRIRNKFGKLILIGFASIIAIQSIINIGAISGILPLTGTPLPFISFGKTALFVFLTMIGISSNVSKYA
ncbi:MAG: hypothetical protein COU08_03320 [Candidatus Harrisonbacteria bacterium CG10_big_fil_rev_8_21_14_0_10_42_17]|uniref:Probable peptidoglycan glycosyltransferase FtsW n=1 Tax=Candidatus Harrisonbacteria bacterium CG10_big_fil_rev_8_21_14_0_10_42_17 TaxID=1974584 RepID=A0A2M6WHV5_9BACT|nr:MAG: hypothetical protein COU08_03320 [Candidatus Harrisonbacteria bacterium CG10_big_fil_rev_8_21_14_0_10_42_17]